MSINRVKLPDGTLINSASEYFRVSADGGVLEWYSGPSTSTLEEFLYVTDIHVVMRSSLHEFFWTERYGREGELKQKVRLRDLEPLAEGALPFDASRVVEGFHQRRED